MAETTADFLHSNTTVTHAPCGSYADQACGDIEMWYCPTCSVLDMQAVLALQAALTAFKASGFVMSNAPEFQELNTRHTPKVKIPDGVRTWTFYVEFDVDDEEADNEYFAYVVLTANGEYQTIAEQK